MMDGDRADDGDDDCMMIDLAVPPCPRDDAPSRPSARKSKPDDNKGTKRSGRKAASAKEDDGTSGAATRKPRRRRAVPKKVDANGSSSTTRQELSQGQHNHATAMASTVGFEIELIDSDGGDDSDEDDWPHDSPIDAATPKRRRDGEDDILITLDSDTYHTDDVEEHREDTKSSSSAAMGVTSIVDGPTASRTSDGARGKGTGTRNGGTLAVVNTTTTTTTMPTVPPSRGTPDKGKEKEEEEEEEGDEATARPRRQPHDVAEQVRQMLDDKSLVLRLDQHFTQTSKILSEGSDAMDISKPYHEVMTTALQKLENAMKELDDDKGGINRTDAIKTTFNVPRDSTYIRLSLESDYPTTYADVDNVERLMMDIPLESRAWIGGMMREPKQGEHRCTNGTDCIGMKLRNIPHENRFVLAQFHLSSEKSEEGSEERILNPNAVCVLCIMHDHASNYIHFMLAGTTAHPNAVCQRFRVSEKAGQYMPMNCFWNPMVPTKDYYGMLGPMPIITLDAFEFRVINGLRHYVHKAPIPSKEMEEKLSAHMGFRTAPSIVNPTRNSPARGQR
jgi:hypothetical protein